MNDTIRAFALSTLALASLAGCEQVVGSGELVTETRVTPSFSRVRVSNALVATIRNGDTDVSLTMDDNLLPLVRTRVEGDVLVVDVEEDVTILPSEGARIVIASPRVEGVSLSGASVASVESRCDDVRLAASGSSVLRARIEAEAVIVDVSGASDATLSGVATTLDVVASGSSSVDSSADVADATLDASGASDVSALVRESVRVRASGASAVRVAGAPQTRDVDTSGSSTVSWE